ncbi:TPA: cation:proton antiporter [Legionella pneumophila]
MFLLARRFFPQLLWQIARTGSREPFTLCIITAAISIAYVASKLFGVSFALGAFFAGMIMQLNCNTHCDSKIRL